MKPDIRPDTGYQGTLGKTWISKVAGGVGMYNVNILDHAETS